MKAVSVPACSASGIIPGLSDSVVSGTSGLAGGSIINENPLPWVVFATLNRQMAWILLSTDTQIYPYVFVLDFIDSLS